MDRLAKQLEGRAQVIRVNVTTPTGLAVARKYNLGATPSLLVFDGQGNVVYSQAGLPNTSAILQAVEHTVR